MKKQVCIKHSSDDTYRVIDDILRYLDIIFVHGCEAVCKFNLYKDHYYLLNEVKKFSKYKISKIKPTCSFVLHGEYFDVELMVSRNEVKMLLQMIVPNELNAVIFCESISMVLNDNDGDFVVIDTKNDKYKAIMALQ